MRRYLLLLIFALIFCFTSVAEARRLALLIGVDEYEEIQSLRCCVNDMKILKQALINIGFRESNIHVLVTGSDFKHLPTKKKIEQKLAEIMSMAQPNDLVLIAFSGHGAQNEKNVYFCPPDTDLNDLEGTCVSITKVMADLAKCKAKFKWMVVDACRNDPTSTRAAKGLQVVPPPPTGIALFQSCSKGELSYEERRSNGNGYFTKNFAAALSGEADVNHDGRITLFEVCDWTADHTKSDVRKAEKTTQCPFFSGSIPNYTIAENQILPKAKELAAAARAAMDKEDFELAVKKYNAALALYPNYAPWKRDRDLALRLCNSKSKFNPAIIVVPDDFATIEEAYKNVKDGGIITIQSGRYELSQTLIVDRPVTFRGKSGNPEDVVIDCPSSNAFQIPSGSPSFQNLTVSCGAEKCGGFYVTGGNPKLFRCVITSRKGDGIMVKGENANPQVESCTLKNCYNSGIRIEDKGLGTFTDCEMSENAKSGIVVTLSGNPNVNRCRIHDTVVGVAVANDGLGSFSNCEIYRTTSVGFAAIRSGNPTVSGCKIHDGAGSGIFVSEKALGSFRNCDIYGNTGSGIVVPRSGNPTVIGCKIHDGKLCGVLVSISGLGKFIDCDIYGIALAGIEVSESGNPTVTGCKIHDGKACGVYVCDKGMGTFSDCEIYGNALAGIEVKESGNPTVTGCKIHDGKQGGVYVNDKGMGMFNNNTLENNFFNGQLFNWYINLTAGAVSGSGNTPPIPAKGTSN